MKKVSFCLLLCGCILSSNVFSYDDCFSTITLPYKNKSKSYTLDTVGLVEGEAGSNVTWTITPVIIDSVESDVFIDPHQKPVKKRV